MDNFPSVKHLLVDLDGTLLGNHAVRLSLDFVTRSVTRLKEYGGVKRAVKTLMAINREFRKPTGSAANDIRIVELFSKKLKMNPEEGRKVIRENLFVIFPELRRHFFPIPGSKEFLDWAKDRYTLILATDPVWPPEIVEMRVSWAGIDPKIFKSMTHIRKMHACKPEERYYQEILSQENLPSELTMLIGNDKKMDLPATRVGIRTFIVGKFKKFRPLKLDGMKAPAYSGSYAHLREFLESQKT